MAIKERVFIVGCPRSGTTLLQSIVAAHPDITSFPESHFFSNLLTKRNRWERWLDLGPKAIHQCIDEFLTKVEHRELKREFPKNYGFAAQHAYGLRRTLDAIADAQHNDIWLEKTPRHLHFISEIEKWIPGAKFIHVVREGQDVVASLHEVTHQHPERWSGARSIDECINRWINDISISRHYIDKPNHLIISYKTIINRYDTVLKSLEFFLGVPFNQETIRDRAALSQNIISKSESWKNRVNQPIEVRKIPKFTQIFSDDEQRMILDKLSSIDIDSFDINSFQLSYA